MNASFNLRALTHEVYIGVVSVLLVFYAGFAVSKDRWTTEEIKRGVLVWFFFIKEREWTSSVNLSSSILFVSCKKKCSCNFLLLILRLKLASPRLFSFDIMCDYIHLGAW